jgi:1-phosphofructokinase
MAETPPRIVVFGPDPLLSVVIEERADRGDEIHLHVGGQGVWVARMAAELGGAPVLCGFVGGETGAVVRGLLASRPGEHRLVPSSQATGSYVIDSRAPRDVVLGHAMAGPRSRHEVDALLSDTCAAAIGAAALVVCNPYPADGLPVEAYAELVSHVQAAGTPVHVDLSGPRLEAALEGRPDLVKLNDWELAEFVRGPVDGPRLEAAAQELRHRGAEVVIVTRGGRAPAIAFTPDGAIEVIPPSFSRGHQEGCGDAMMGALAVSLGSGDTLPAALALGAAAGAANFLRRGLGSASREVVEELLQSVVVRPYAPVGIVAA